MECYGVVYQIKVVIISKLVDCTGFQTRMGNRYGSDRYMCWYGFPYPQA